MVDYLDVFPESDGKVAISIGDTELLLNQDEANALYTDLGFVLQDIADFNNQISQAN